MATKMGSTDSLDVAGKTRDKSPYRDNSLVRDLIKKRGIIKGRFTKFANYLNLISTEATLTNQQNVDLKLRMQSSTNLFSEYNIIQTQIEESVPDTDLDEQLTQRELFENYYYTILSKAECLSNNQTIARDTQNSSHLNNSVKLPTIHMPTFDGSYEHWLEFRDTFLSLVHNSKEISNIQKFHYLKSCLKGSAELVIDSLEFSSHNYEVAWELLLNRYNNSRLLIHNHVKSLFNLPALNKESPYLLRKLIDTVLKNLRALKILGEPTDSWDTLVIYIIVSRLDHTTEREWEQHKGTLLSDCTDSKSTIKITDLFKFLKDRADMLETLILSQTKPHNNKLNVKPKIQCNVSHDKALIRKGDHKKPCLACSGKHSLYTCKKFLDFSLESKLAFVKNNKLCVNCLRAGHSVINCKFGTCRLCNDKHNSLIHTDNTNDINPSDFIHASHATNERAATMHSTHLACASPARPHPSGTAEPIYANQVNEAHIDNNSYAQFSSVNPVLLSTALVQVADIYNNYHLACALLDSGSQRCFITKSLCDLLNTPLVSTTTEIRGVGNSVTQTSEVCDIEIKSRANTDYLMRLRCYVLPSITSSLPAVSKQCARFIPNTIQLANPNFCNSQKIDLLIGADKFWELLKTDKIRLPNGPFLQDTHLGWIISGQINLYSRPDNNIRCNLTQSLEVQLRKFWELEELHNASVDTRTDEERACEKHFTDNTKRSDDGRFSVRIPFKLSPETLGETYSRAERRFLVLEKRLQRNDNYRKLYTDFIHEYISLGHMTRVHTYNNPHYFMPHHGVFREHSTTTKLRVVFDASAASSTGISLNDLQMVGPPIQGDLLSILLRFRQHKYTACADIEKMYRQCLVDENQRDLQLILWRDDPSEPVGIYRLNTVTYGTASAPYLSCRCLKQLASECTDPEIRRIINEDFYVDDMITGHDDKNTLLQYCETIANVLHSGCFPLRKWMYNFDCKNIQNLNSCFNSKILNLGENVNAKTLGLGWYNLSDEFYFNSQYKHESEIITKRYIMSIVSQIFDPLGLLSPVIITAKVLLQRLWLLKLGWDDELPSDVVQAWRQFANALPLLNTIRVPRHVIGNNPEYLELHIFTDASESAYGACVYVRSAYSDRKATSKLLCSKSKVAPLKPVSIPRLELCGALLGARLYDKVRASLRCKFRSVVFWCDSTIVLGWLRMAPNMLKTFVQNRVVEIHELTKESVWRHVSGKENPADLVSRGVRLEDLSSSTRWWEGPSFLCDFNGSAVGLDQIHEISNESLPELKTKTTYSLVAGTHGSFKSIFAFQRFSSFNRMRRAGAYVLRFIHNTRHKNDRRVGDLSINELNNADIMLVRFSQLESFENEYNLIQNNKELKTKNLLLKLHLFTDKNKILRVGGRLSNSRDFSFNKKHPILISCKHWFSVLLFRHEHKQLRHAGPQALLYNVRERYWPVGGRDLARQTVHSCVTCRRFRGKTLTPLMGNLPQERITPSFPFLRCGVDYAGPVFILNRKGRGSKLVKGYICLFICFVTRAVHLELVSDLSTDAYLLALKRFISRRGKPNEIFSDNGKNFIGLMNDFSKFLSECSTDIIAYATSQNIKFKFIPPYSPHFGGLWEAGIKSCKHHLLRSTGNAHLTYEEYSTVLTQIEAILNSRPLSPLSTHPDDYLPLSPGHFLVGRPLTAPASPDFQDVPVLRLDRYQRLEQIRQHFWTRWAKEYVSELQTRGKWRENKCHLRPNTLVVIKEDNSPPLKWSLGRIIATVPGRDGISRVADIRTAAGVIRRAFTKICPLLDNETSSLEVGASKAGGMLEH